MKSLIDIKMRLKGEAEQRLKSKNGVAILPPNPRFGSDFALSCFKAAAEKAISPKEAAESASANFKDHPEVDKIELVDGFINVFLKDEALLEAGKSSLDTKPTNYKDKVVVAEYSDANPFKVMHAGHVYTTVIGDAIATLLELAGGKVHRVNFGGDVGLHVAKAMWAIITGLGGENTSKLKDIPADERAGWLSENYTKGHAAYEDDEAAKAAIIETNKRVYKVHSERDHDSDFAKIYWTCRQWSYEAFDDFYARLGTKLEKYYPESEVADLGLETVKKQIGKVFVESDGAVVFKGEKHDLHTRVFINQQGLPTYEAKDVGLILKKYADYHFDISVIVTDNEQMQYMEVVLKAIEQFEPNLVKATRHINHGKLKLTGGVKMSSRLGNTVRATEVLDSTADALRDAGREPNDPIVLGAIKYAFLKMRIGGDIIYDPKESIALDGNSGPYLQYAHARARSILKKASIKSSKVETSGIKLKPAERALTRKIGEYAEVLQKTVDELMPHYICTYLYELAQVFNRFYEHSKVIGDPRQNLRLSLVSLYADALKDGLSSLGIESPDKI